MFLVDDEICNDILKLVLVDFSDENINYNEDINKNFSFKIAYRKEGQQCIKKFKLVSFDKTNNAGEMPIVNVTFTC